VILTFAFINNPSMNIASEIKNIKSRLEHIRDEELLKAIKNLLDFGLKNQASKPGDFWMELTDAQRKSAEKGMRQIKSGKRKSHARVMNQLRK
jgi:hypothetical protein